MADSIWLSVSHFKIAWLTNSGPLSERRSTGAPWMPIKRARTPITRMRRMLLATSIQALRDEFIDDGQALKLLAVGAGVEDKIVGPDMMRSQRC